MRLKTTLLSGAIALAGAMGGHRSALAQGTSTAPYVSAFGNPSLSATSVAYGDLNGPATFVDVTHGLPVNCVAGCPAPDQLGTGSINSATLNAAYTVSLANGEGITSFAVSGLNSGHAVLTLEGSNDGGTTWTGINEINLSGVLQSTVTTDGQFRVNTAGRTKVRLRVSTIGSGTISVASSASSATGMVALSAPLPPGTNALGSVSVAAMPGSIGADFSANKPTLPNVGSNFAASGPYASYVLVATAPASPTRASIDVENNSGAQIVVVRDDGTAATGSAPVNASVFALGGGATVGSQGGSWPSTTFKGRVQVYAPSSIAQVSVGVE